MCPAQVYMSVAKKKKKNGCKSHTAEAALSFVLVTHEYIFTLEVLIFDVITYLLLRMREFLELRNVLLS